LPLFAYAALSVAAFFAFFFAFVALSFAAAHRGQYTPPRVSRPTTAAPLDAALGGATPAIAALQAWCAAALAANAASAGARAARIALAVQQAADAAFVPEPEPEEEDGE
jgi:hypothetical protein